MGLTIATTGQTRLEADDYGDVIVTNDVEDGSSAQFAAFDGLGRHISIDTRNGLLITDTDGRAVSLTTLALFLAAPTSAEAATFGSTAETAIIYLDPTPGAAKLVIRAFDSNGLAVHGEIPLSA